MKYQKYHVIAQITLLENVAEPKVNGVRSGYSPHHKFDYWDFLLSGKHLYADDELHYAGESLKTQVSFLCWEDIQQQLKVGDKFEVYELYRQVGVGVIESIIG